MVFDPTEGKTPRSCKKPFPPFTLPGFFHGLLKSAAAQEAVNDLYVLVSFLKMMKIVLSSQTSVIVTFEIEGMTTR